MNDNYLYDGFINEVKGALAHKDSDVYSEGFAAGEKSEYDRFWDAFQRNGALRGYSYCFQGLVWTNDTFRPKYDLIPDQAYSMFSRCDIKDLRKQAIKRTIDFSGCLNAGIAFAYSNVEYLPELNFTTLTVLDNIFANCLYLKSIDKVVFPKTVTAMGVNLFASCYSLVDVTFEGTCPLSIYMHYCPLSVDTMRSLISCLANYAGTESEYAYELKFSDTSWANLEASGPAPDGGTWKEYVMELGWLT